MLLNVPNLGFSFGWKNKFYVNMKWGVRRYTALFLYILLFTFQSTDWKIDSELTGRLLCPQLIYPWLFDRYNFYLQWPRSLRHEISSPSQTLVSWVQIQLEACMSVCVYFCLCCPVGSRLATASSPVQGVLPTVCKIQISELILNGNTPECLIRQDRRIRKGGRILTCYSRFQLVDVSNVFKGLIYCRIFISLFCLARILVTRHKHVLHFLCFYL
jgi:hypothetical protein